MAAHMMSARNIAKSTPDSVSWRHSTASTQVHQRTVAPSSKRSTFATVASSKQPNTSAVAAEEVSTGRPIPAAPEGTPVVEPQKLRSRPRRNRRSQTVRSAFSETFLTPSNFILPVFVHDGEDDIPIGAMPGVSRLGYKHGLLKNVAEARAAGVNSVVVFPKTPDHLKTMTGEEAFNPDGLAQRTISLLKDTYPDLEVYTDVALDPYSCDGHDGIVRDDGVIMNDETVHYLCKQAVSQARAGADVVSPSDMMDGRVGAIRDALDSEGFSNVSIMSYTAKYASAFYGPFREALDSAPVEGTAQRIIPPNKKTYQQDPANYREAIREAALDELEGADIMMVKPAGAYLDIIRALRDNSTLPISAYQVSGEYSMLKAAAAAGMLDEKDAVLESLLSIRRAGADIILSYYAVEAAKWMQDEC
ncbi:hypothetical protein CYMTET_42431 [Cymbomonas tetramitiformis]|uniref:Delta-aminolevulinic acid dehydratase n=1 Tax=Cymbomonas tetramitiformis TaxID=36881 RepID=A0AAE0F104_9CHLO|nr:hypothetical protein CYMTET_42431 [Cymbomonas tetramitiformis]